MSWSLQINVTRPKYKPGDTVFGWVHLVSQCVEGQAVNVRAIMIEFTGRSTTAKHWPRIPDSARLFSIKTPLFTGPKTLYATYGQGAIIGQSKWPFWFTLPLDCRGAHRGSCVFPSYLNPDPNQPLPVSFVDDNVQHGSCSIIYELQATLTSPLEDGYYTNEGGTKKLEITVYRPRSIEHPSFNLNTKTAAFTHRDLSLLPIEGCKLAHRPLTIKETLKLKLPKAVFEIRVQTPTGAVIGCPLTLMLHLDYNLDASTVPQPKFLLKRVTIYLCEETSIWSSKRAGGHESIRWTKELTLHETEFQDRIPRVEDYLDLRIVMDTTVPHGLTPTFKTFNIARTYSLKVFVRLHCAGKEHLVSGDYKPCTLLAEEFDSQTAPHNEPAPVIDNGDHDPPPPYHVVMEEVPPEYSVQAHAKMPPGHSRASENADAVLGAAESSTATASNSRATAPSTANA